MQGKRGNGPKEDDVPYNEIYLDKTREEISIRLGGSLKKEPCHLPLKPEAPSLKLSQPTLRS